MYVPRLQEMESTRTALYTLHTCTLKRALQTLKRALISSKEPFKPSKEPYKPSKEPYKPTKEPYKPTKEPYKPTKEPYKPSKELSYPRQSPMNIPGPQGTKSARTTAAVTYTEKSPRNP